MGADDFEPQLPEWTTIGFPTTAEVGGGPPPTPDYLAAVLSEGMRCCWGEGR